MRVPAALAALAAALAIAAGGGDPASGDEGPIKVGAWFPLSGPVAASGIPQMQGATAAFKQINAEGGINGRNVEFIARDNAFDPQQTIQVARRLIGSDLVNPDFVKVAESFGMAGWRSKSPKQLRRMLEQAFSLDAPVLIEVNVSSVPEVLKIVK